MTSLSDFHSSCVACSCHNNRTEHCFLSHAPLQKFILVRAHSRAHSLEDKHLPAGRHAHHQCSSPVPLLAQAAGVMIGLSLLDMLLPNIEQYGWVPCMAYFLVGWGAIMILAKWTDGLDEWANSLYPDTDTSANADTSEFSVGHRASSVSPRKAAPSARHEPRREPGRATSGAVPRGPGAMSRSSSAVSLLEDDDEVIESVVRHMMPTEAPLTAAPLAFDKQLRAKRVKGAILTTVALALHNAPVSACFMSCEHTHALA